MDWQPGDLALCIGASDRYPPEVQPGTVHEVEYVWLGAENADDPSWIDTCLDLTGIDRMEGDLAFWAGNFTKITPGTEIQGAEKDNRLPVKTHA